MVERERADDIRGSTQSHGIGVFEVLLIRSISACTPFEPFGVNRAGAGQVRCRQAARVGVLAATLNSRDEPRAVAAGGVTEYPRAGQYPRIGGGHARLLQRRLGFVGVLGDIVFAVTSPGGQAHSLVEQYHSIGKRITK